MKKITVLIFLALPLFTLCQKKFYFTFNSNIEYAPFGFGFITSPTDTKPGYFFTVKFSEDHFTRNVNNRWDESKENIFDVDEVIITAGVNKNIIENIDFNLGVGFLSGNIYSIIASKIQTSSDGFIWTKSTKQPPFFPVLTWGLSFNKGRIKLLMGYDVAFVKPDKYPVVLLNSRSVARLTGVTLGLGIGFGNV
jgi:hypothetical protein